MITAYQSALSGLQAFGKKIHANANNIANANTESFKKSTVTLSSTQPHGVKANVGKLDTPGPSVYKETSAGQELVELSNVDLGSELPGMMLNSHFYKANLKTIDTVEEMTGTLLDLKS